MRKKLFRTAKGREELPVPTAAEIRLLQILWDLQSATVEEVVDAHQERKKPNYKTTQTLLRIMEQKGFITHEVRGRVFVFTPLADRKTINDLSVRELVSRNFHGSMAGLLVNLLETTSMKKKDFDQIESYLREYRRKHKLNNRE